MTGDGERGRGRPVGAPDTKGAILSAALQSFVEKGFQATSLRGVAAAAGVDDGTVRHHFGDKVGLLLATMRISQDPRELIPRVAAGGRRGLGHRIVATLVRLYGSPIGLAAKQAVREHPEVGQMLVRVLATQLVEQSEQLFPEISPSRRRERAAVVQAIVSGIGISRFLLEVGPLSGLPEERVVAVFGPIVQAAIDGRLDAP